MDSIECPWPYTVRRSQRARHLRIQLTLGKPIEVIYPKRSSKAEAMLFLRDRLNWISKQHDYIASLNQPNYFKLPTQLTFPCLQQAWQLNTHIDKTRQRTTLMQTNTAIHLTGPEQSDKQWLIPIRRWLKTQALNQLQPVFEALSQQFDLPYQTLSWRFQKTRWGSCSDQQRITLNVKLLFLTLEQVHYVMLHELCHTKNMSHSRSFWRLLQQYCPQAITIDQLLYKENFKHTHWLEQ